MFIVTIFLFQSIYYETVCSLNVHEYLIVCVLQFQGDWFVVSKYMSMHHRSHDKWDPSCQKISYAVTKGENDTRVDMQVTLKERTGQTHEIDVKGKLLWAGHGKDSSVSEVVWKMDKKNKWSCE